MPSVQLPESAPRRRAAALCAALLLVPLAAGCTGGGDLNEGKSGSTVDVSAVERAQIRSGGTLRWAVEALPSTLNTFHAEANAATDRVAGATLPALFTVDAQGRPQLNEDYLASAEVVDEEPQQVVVYTLRPKARWSDGTRISAADFTAQWNALSGSDGGYWTAHHAGYEQIHKVTPGPGPHEVKVVFARPYADWRALFTPLYPRAVTAEAKDFNTTSRRKLALSAGPFKLADGALDPKADTLTLERNPRWWGDRAKLDSIVLTEVPFGERDAALADGALDLAEVRAPVVRHIAEAARPEEAPGNATADVATSPAPGKADGKNEDEEKKEEAKEEAEQDKEKDEKAEEKEKQKEKQEAEQKEEDKKAEKKEAEKAEDAERAEDAEKEDEKEEDKKAEEKAKAAEKRRKAAEEAARKRANLREYTVRRAYAPSYTQLALNGTSGPLRDERVRRAVGRALDRAALAEEVHGEAGLPARALGSHLRMYGQEGYRDNSPALGEATGASAAALLAAAGWKGGPVAAGSGAGDDARPGAAGGALSAFTGVSSSSVRGHAAVLMQVARADARAVKAAKGAKKKDGEEAERLAKEAQASMATAKQATELLDTLLRAETSRLRVKEGEKLELRMVLPTGEGTEGVRATGQRIARMLARVGVGVELTRVPGDDFFLDHIASGDFDLALYAWPATAYPATDARSIYAKPVPAPDGSLLIEQNYTRVGTDQIDRLFEQAVAELDGEERGELLRKIDTRIWAAAGSIPLYQPPQFVAVRRTLANAGAFGLRSPRYQDIGYLRADRERRGA
ncbi:ABC transporter family substrate-binding protein [Streptomyces sp. WMMC897]|uniref:ABC transporter family substrate-binding protein n=1 Tax=Streptomyces sp. WMMC897 TaxID=3014782 RepID=UPI0022B74079|nr:ABC transporter family substrate-binding protein [Streptomyces sp. WMMC897]MCZ7416732.1 ABC transporter family substrate-binding protein [Streptomyces sp. WMMC897]